VKVKAATPHVSPWRTLQIGDDPGDLITSYLILNLNEPNALGDVSWVRPAKYVGIWWDMHIGTRTWATGAKHGATTAYARRLIDFAADHGFGGVLVEGWNVGWDGDWTRDRGTFQFTTPTPDFDIEQLARYGARKGVRLIGHHETGADVDNYERQMEAAFAYYRGLGINTVKTGYVGWGQHSIQRTDANGRKHGEWHHGQCMVRHYRKVVETAARYQIMLDVHEPIKDTGIRRTYPNMMTREGARGQEYDAWSDDGGNPPDHTTILPFTRLLAGPMDFTPGTFDLLVEQKPDNRVNTTLAKQLALYVVIYSPLQMASDLPEHYEAKPDVFRFIERVPCDWNDTVVLDAKIGDTVTIARQERDGRDWFVGSITDENARTIAAGLDFLEPGMEYVATIYRDGPGADWQTNPLPVEIVTETVTRDTVLQLKLAPGGGQAIHLRPTS
jgi:alpha-glucosidase